jgi:hypothetical protein
MYLERVGRSGIQVGGPAGAGLALGLRPLPCIAAGYALGPLAGLTVMWLSWLAQSVSDPQFLWGLAFRIWLLMIIVGGPVCLAVELAVVTPLLLGFRRYRWRWLNGWSALGAGFAVGTVFPLIAASLAHAARSEWGLYDAVQASAGFGAVGTASALVFRLIAVGNEAHPRATRRFWSPGQVGLAQGRSVGEATVARAAGHH